MNVPAIRKLAGIGLIVAALQVFSLHAGLPVYSGKMHWDKTSGTLRFTTSGSMPEDKEAFFWKVPAEVQRIIINAGVTVKGGFQVEYRRAQNPLWIQGADRKTSVIFGTDEQRWAATRNIPDHRKWEYSSVSVVEDATVLITNLTSRNPKGYHISGYANCAVVHLSHCDLLDERPGVKNNSDGFAGAAGSSIKNSFISTSDDAIKLYNDITIEDVVIEQGRNGAALQLGWGRDNSQTTANIKNLRIVGTSPDGRYNMAPITWQTTGKGVRNLHVTGLTIQIRGSMLLEKDRWVPVGLFKLKPSGGTFNMQVDGADITTESYGVVNTRGVIDICGNTAPTNCYRCTPEQSPVGLKKKQL